MESERRRIVVESDSQENIKRIALALAELGLPMTISIEDVDAAQKHIEQEGLPEEYVQYNPAYVRTIYDPKTGQDVPAITRETFGAYTKEHETDMRSAASTRLFNSLQSSYYRSVGYQIPNLSECLILSDEIKDDEVVTHVLGIRAEKATKLADMLQWKGRRVSLHNVGEGTIQAYSEFCQELIIEEE